MPIVSTKIGVKNDENDRKKRHVQTQLRNKKQFDDKLLKFSLNLERCRGVCNLVDLEKC